MKKIVLVLVIVLTTIVVSVAPAAACGGGDQPPPDEPPPVVPDEPEEPPVVPDEPEEQPAPPPPPAPKPTPTPVWVESFPENIVGLCDVAVVPSRAPVIPEDPVLTLTCSNKGNKSAHESLIWVDLPNWTTNVNALFLFEDDIVNANIDNNGIRTRAWYTGFDIPAESTFKLIVSFDYEVGLSPGIYDFPGNWSWDGKNQRQGVDFGVKLELY